MTILTCAMIVVGLTIRAAKIVWTETARTWMNVKLPMSANTNARIPMVATCVRVLTDSSSKMMDDLALIWTSV